VGDADDVAGAALALLEGLDGIFGALIAEVAEERVAGAEREEAEGRALAVLRDVEQAVDDLEGGAVATDGDEVPAGAGDFGAGELAGLAPAEQLRLAAALIERGVAWVEESAP